MSHQTVKVRREAVAPCMTCPLCHRLLRKATTIIECLHTFCRRCIRKKLTKEEMDCCPVCYINLGCAPKEKLRPDHNLQVVRAKIFPHKRITVKAPEAVTPVVPHTKRKKRSLSSLVERSPQVALTGRRSKSVSRKASRGSNSTVEKLVTTLEDQPQSSSSQVDLWKPLTCLAEAASGSKSAISEEQQSYDNEGLVQKTKTKEQRKKAKVNHTPPESEKPKKLHKVHQTAQDFGELRVSPQDILDAGSAKHDRINYPIWFTLVASDEKKQDVQPLPQISASYLRMKNGTMPVSFIQKYLQRKLDLPSEVEVKIKCMGQTVIPTMTLNNLVDLWLQTTSTERVSVTVGSSAKDFVMVLTTLNKLMNLQQQAQRYLKARQVQCPVSSTREENNIEELAA